MRVRTEDRRQAILAVAAEIFRSVGYERASMTMIAGRLGGSKGTLYGYFKSKDELFATVMYEVMERQADGMLAMLDDTGGDPEKVLLRFGEAYLEFLTSPDSLSIIRTAIAEGGNSRLGAILYEKGPDAGWTRIARYLKRLADTGTITIQDTRVAAAHLKGLLETGVLEPLLFGAEPWFSPAQAAANAVRAFLRAYETPGAPMPPNRTQPR